ncbi:MAG: hypothetical protein M3R15_33480 [Acidobacteriota bacterium]|nr:hypothetical protein [Acidobacteriota bacterium]
MNEDTTQQLPAFEARIIAAIAEMRAEMSERLTAIEGEISERLTAIEGEVAATKGEVAATRQAFHTRISTLEEKADERARETRPLWEEMRATLEEIRLQLNEALRDLMATRTRVARLKESQRQPTA